MENLEAELKQLLIETFDLEGMNVADIDSEAPLFGEGLGSIPSMPLNWAWL